MRDYALRSDGARSTRGTNGGWGMKTPEFKAGEQNVYAYQAAHRLSTLRYAIKNLFRWA